MRALIAIQTSDASGATVESMAVKPAGFFASASRTSWPFHRRRLNRPATLSIALMRTTASSGSTPTAASELSAIAALARLKSPGIDKASGTSAPSMESSSSRYVLAPRGLAKPHVHDHPVDSNRIASVHTGHDEASATHAVGTSHHRTSRASRAAKTTRGSLAFATTIRPESRADARATRHLSA